MSIARLLIAGDSVILDLVIHIENFDMVSFGDAQKLRYEADLTSSLPGLSTVRGDPVWRGLQRFGMSLRGCQRIDNH